MPWAHPQASSAQQLSLFRYFFLKEKWARPQKNCSKATLVKSSIVIFIKLVAL